MDNNLLRKKYAKKCKYQSKYQGGSGSNDNEEVLYISEILELEPYHQILS